MIGPMRKVRPLLIGLLLAPGVLIGTWIGTGSGQGTAPPRPPGDAVTAGSDAAGGPEHAAGAAADAAHA